MANTIGIQLEVDTKEVKDAGVQVDKFTKTIDGADDALEDLNGELDKTGKKAKKATKDFDGLDKSTRGTKKSFDEAATSTRKANDNLEEINKSMKDTVEQTQMMSGELDGAKMSADDFSNALDIDPGQFDAAQRKIIISLDRSTIKLDKASRAVDRFEEDQKSAGRTISATGKVLDRQGNEVVKLTRRWEDTQSGLNIARAGFDKARKSADNLTVSTAKASKGFKLQKNSAQQLGYQLQDVAVQAQMGASWFTIIGQQGSQLAGVLGPSGALLGAVIGIGAAVGGVLAKTFFSASESSDELRGKIDSLTGSIKDLSQANRDFISQDEASKIKKREKEITSLSKEITKYESKLEGVAGAQEKFDNITGNSTSADRRRGRLELEIKSTEKYSEKLVELRAQLSLAKGSVKESKGIIDEVSITAVDVWKNSMLDAIAITGKAENERWIAIKEGQRVRKEEVKTLQMIDDLSKSIALSDMGARDSAIEKARIQQSALDKVITASTEKELQTIANSNMSKIDLENTLYSQSISNLQIYREQKSLTDAEYNSAESLLYEAHLGKLNAIEIAANQKRKADNLEMLSNIATGFDIFGDLQEASQVKKKQQLDADLRNSQNFTAAQIANKEKEAKAIFKAQKNADLASIVSSTAVGVMGQLAQGNWVGAGAVGAAGVLNYAKASSNSYSSPAGVSNSSSNAPPPSQNTTNNSGGNTTNINFSGATGDSVETVIQYIKDQGILFDQDSAQAQVLRS